jgi:hypothetical protein
MAGELFASYPVAGVRSTMLNGEKLQAHLQRLAVNLKLAGASADIAGKAAEASSKGYPNLDAIRRYTNEAFDALTEAKRLYEELVQ